MPSFPRVGGLSGCLCLPLLPLSAPTPAADSDSLQRGRYLVQIAGCNDCHTAGYAMAPEKVPESAWLTGDQLGWSGPWGTTYPSNLRLYMQGYKRGAVAGQRAPGELPATHALPCAAHHER